MDQFVCVRVVQGWGMDLSLFQFDHRLTWAIFFLNADRSVYGRFGGRGPKERRELDREAAISALRKALEGALEIHKGYPGNKKDLAGKTGPAPVWPTPESIPTLKGKPNAVQADGVRHGCIHCHQVPENEIKSLRAAKREVPLQLLAPWPSPDRLGLRLDPAERATVREVEASSAAERAGFKPADRILRLEGQPILSTADVQWVLHQAKDAGAVKAEVDRGGRKVPLTLDLPAGWRR